MRVIFLACVGLALSAGTAAAACRDDLVALRGDWGEARFSVEIADTDESRAQGLMFVEKMPTRTGMLFVYDAPQRAVFWMKNTLIPLDMIFVRANGVVQHVHHEAVPGDLTSIDGGQNVLMVLEINGGLARRYGISAGDQLQHPRLPQDLAIWSC